MISLDVVRGIAAVTVLLTHLGVPFAEGSLPYTIVSSYHWSFRTFIWCNSGIHAAVVVFIVLSGFCIHKPLAGDNGILGRGYWFCYARRRFFRIYPVLLLAIILGLVSQSIVSGWKNTYLMDSIGALTGLSALVPAGGPVGNGPLGTVIVECVLYVAYPFIMVIKRRIGWTAVVGAASLLYLTNMAALVLSGGPVIWFQRSFFAFLLYWIIGALAVEAAVRVPTYRHGTSGAAILVSYLVYLASCHLIQFNGSHYFKSVMLALVTAHLLCFLYQRERSKPIRGRLAEGLSFVGERSYSLYATHLPVLSLVAFVLHQNGSTSHGPYIAYALAILSATTLTMASYHFVEAPCHEFAKSLSIRDGIVSSGTLRAAVRA